MILRSLPRASVKAECVHLNAEHNHALASTNLCLGVKKTQGGGWWAAATLSPGTPTQPSWASRAWNLAEWACPH